MTGTRMNPGAFSLNDTVYFAGGQKCADATCTKGVDIATIEFYNTEVRCFDSKTK